MRVLTSARAGGYVVNITGTLLGPQDYSIKANVQGTPCEFTRWVSPSAIMCKVARGVSLSAPITATIIGPDQGLDRVTVEINAGLSFSFDEVWLRTIQDPSNGPASGHQSITFNGANFGTFDMTGRSVLGNTACEASVWISNTNVVCKNSPGGL